MTCCDYIKLRAFVDSPSSGAEFHSSRHSGLLPQHYPRNLLSITEENETTDQKETLPFSSIAPFPPAESTSDSPLNIQEQQLSLEQSSEVNQRDLKFKSFDPHKSLAKAADIRSKIKAFKADTEMQIEFHVKKMVENELNMKLLELKIQDLKSRVRIMDEPPLQDQQQQEPLLPNRMDSPSPAEPLLFTYPEADCSFENARKVWAPKVFWQEN